MQTIKKYLFIPAVAVLTLLHINAMADSDCEIKNIQKTLVSSDASKIRFVLEDCTVPQRQLNPRCRGKGKGICKPVITAALNGSVPIMNMLAEAGADIDVNGNGTTGDTPLIIAVIQNNPQLVDLLVEMGADVNKANHFGATPFWGACAEGYTDYVKLFLENGAQINQPGRFPDPLKEHKQIVNGITPLMAASYSGNHDVVSFLLQNKADITLRDSVDRTAVDYALGANQTAIAELLQNAPLPASSTSEPKRLENGSGESIAQAIQRALALATDHGASGNARLERFTGTITGNEYDNWDFSLRDNASMYRVRFDSSNKAEVFKRSEKQDAVRDYWATVKSASSIADLDGLVIVAKHRVVEAGFTPTDYTHLKYSVPGSRAPKTAPREKLEVFFEIAGEEQARRAIFHDGQFQRLTPAKIIKIRIPTVLISQPKIPAAEIPTVDIPEVRIPEMSDPNIRIQENEQLVILTLWSDILFDFDKWNIRYEAEEALGQILEVLTGRYAELPFEIHGHTDSMGTEAYNIDLSKRRANSVKEWLITHGIQEQRISIYPHGELQPIAPNSKADGTDNPEGRQKNRRVEIRIHK